MSNEEINVAIAEECGWKWTDETVYSPSGSSNCRLSRILEDRIHSIIPNYAGDLNAMHEVEKILTAEQEEDYVERLSAEIMSEAYGDAMKSETALKSRWSTSNLSSSDSTCRTPAKARAICFLRTIGKWRDA